MAISYPLSFPSVSIRDITWEAKTKVAVTESPFTGEQQIVEHDGQWFEAQISLPPLERAEAKRAETKQFKFNLTPAYLYTLFEKQNGLCALTGRCLTFHKSNGKGTMDRDSASIDRIDSGKGYIQGNVQWVCSFANIMKQRFTNQEFIKLCKDVVRYNT
jgi:hypothetical protein